MTTPQQPAKPSTQPQLALPRVQNTPSAPAPRAPAQAQAQSTRPAPKPTPVLESESYSDAEADSSKGGEHKSDSGSEAGSDTEIGSEEEEVEEVEEEEEDDEDEVEEIEDDDEEEAPAARKPKSTPPPTKSKPKPSAAAPKKPTAPPPQPAKKRKAADMYKRARERMGHCFAAHMKSRFEVTNGAELIAFLESGMAPCNRLDLVDAVVARMRENVSVADTSVSAVACMLSEMKTPGKDLWALFLLTHFVPCYTQAHEAPTNELERAKSSALDFLMISGIAAGKACFRAFSQKEENIRQMKSFAFDYALLDLISCMHPERMIKANHIVMVMLDPELHGTEKSGFISYKPSHRIAVLSPLVLKSGVDMANPAPLRKEHARTSPSAGAQKRKRGAPESRPISPLHMSGANSDSSGEEDAAGEPFVPRPHKRAHTDSPVPSSLQYFSNMHMIMVADMELQKVEQRIAWLESETGAQRATRALLQERVKALRASCTPQDAWEQLHAHATLSNPFATF